MVYLMFVFDGLVVSKITIYNHTPYAFADNL